MGVIRRLVPQITYAVGVMLGSALGFFSPAWYLGFAPLSAGVIFAAFYLVDDGEGATSGNAARPPRR